MSDNSTQPSRWYDGVTRYQWLVLVIASLGWVFDVFEGQIFVASMNEAMPSLLPDDVATDEQARRGAIAWYNRVSLAAFLMGGALGGIVFGAMSDRIGRRRTMSLTILFYSVFTFASALSQTWWHMAICRFLVALGVGGEWAVASALVAEVFPQKARAWSLGIFHASSVFGTFLAIAAGAFIVGNPALQNTAYPSLPWRLGFMVGVLPSLLIIWIRRSLREPETWEQARTAADKGGERMGRVSELFASQHMARTAIGVGLAAIGLATFWGVHIYGKDLMLRFAPKDMLTPKNWEMIGMLLVTTGGGLGLISFGPITEWLGRRFAFFAYHVGGVASALVAFNMLSSWQACLVVLPIFGFLTLGMHAGYAIYFPELFPTRLRGTGVGFCFNAGRILAAPILLFSGQVIKAYNYSPEQVASALSLLYILGAGIALAAPETRGRELPE